MTENDTQRPPPIDKGLLERFKEDVRERRGKLRGNYGTELERAIEAYLDRSNGGDTDYRLECIEGELEDIKGMLSENDGKRKKESGVTNGGSTTDKRIRQINTTITEENGNQPKVHEQVVEMAIREHAGSSDPTIRRYKELLKQDQELFDHPVKDSLYFRSSEDYTKAVNALAKGGQLTGNEYESIVSEFGEDWWSEQLADESHDERGIQ